MIGRSVTAVAAAFAAFACCVAGSLFHRVRLVAHVDDVSAWNALRSRWSVVYASWRASTTAADWVLFVGVAALAAGLVVARPVLTRFAGAGRRTE